MLAHVSSGARTVSGAARGLWPSLLALLQCLCVVSGHIHFDTSVQETPKIVCLPRSILVLRLRYRPHAHRRAWPSPARHQPRRRAARARRFLLRVLRRISAGFRIRAGLGQDTCRRNGRLCTYIYGVGGLAGCNSSGAEPCGARGVSRTVGGGYSGSRCILGGQYVPACDAGCAICPSTPQANHFPTHAVKRRLTNITSWVMLESRGWLCTGGVFAVGTCQSYLLPHTDCHTLLEK